MDLLQTLESLRKEHTAVITELENQKSAMKNNVDQEQILEKIQVWVSSSSFTTFILFQKIVSQRNSRYVYEKKDSSNPHFRPIGHH